MPPIVSDQVLKYIGLAAAAFLISPASAACYETASPAEALCETIVEIQDKVRTSRQIDLSEIEKMLDPLVGERVPALPIYCDFVTWNAFEEAGSAIYSVSIEPIEVGFLIDVETKIIEEIFVRGK